jgi:hypothetical protein
MPPLNVQLVLYTQVWALLEGYTPFTTAFPKAGQRIKSTAGDARAKETTRSSPAEFPRISIEVSEDTANDRAPLVFGQNRTDFSSAVCDYGVPVRLVLTVRVVHDKTDLASQSVPEAAVRGGLLRAGPNLGIAWVSRSTLRPVSRREENNADTNNTRRTISRFRLEVDAMPKLSQLTAT